MANQKLKEFFGGVRTTMDFDLSQNKADFERIIDKVNQFCQCLKEYYDKIASLPMIVEKMYGTLLAIQQQCCYDVADFRDCINDTIIILGRLVDEQSNKYGNFFKHTTIQQTTIKEHLKQLNESRQRYDHYKVKLQGLMSEYMNIVDSKTGEKVRKAKETLDRNQVKLADAENDYSKRLSTTKERLAFFQTTIKTMSLSTFTETLYSGVRTVISLAEPANNILQFIQTKSSKKQDKPKTQKIPIEQYFQRKKEDVFPNFQNIFLDPSIKTTLPFNMTAKTPIQLEVGIRPPEETKLKPPKNIGFDEIFSQPKKDAKSMDLLDF